MRQESKNWKLVKDKELLELLPEDNVKCEDCGTLIQPQEKWKAFLKSSKVSKGFSNGYTFRTTAELYCQKCASE